MEALDVVVVAVGPAADGGAVVHLLAGQQHRPAVGEEVERVAIGDGAVAVTRQVEFADHLRPQQAHGVGRDGVAIARMEFLGDGGTAHDRPPLDHERAEARLAEIGRGREPVMPGPDDDGLPDFCHRFPTATSASDTHLSSRGQCACCGRIFEGGPGLHIGSLNRGLRSPRPCGSCGPAGDCRCSGFHSRF